MPRKKTIDEERIRLEKIDAKVAEVKNCLGVELIFNSTFTAEEIEVLKKFYHFQVSSSGQMLSRPIKNSWKGLVMMLVSVAYCRYQDKVVAQIWNCSHHKKIRSRWNLHIDFNYTAFLSADELKELQQESQVIFQKEEIIKAIASYFQDREAHKAKSKARQEQKLKELLKKRPPDPNFENVPAPTTWPPCYMSGKYEPKDIETHLKMFTNLLDIDAKESVIITDYAKQTPHKYEVVPAKYLG